MWLSPAEQGHYTTHPTALIPHGPSVWEGKAARTMHNRAWSQHSIRSRLDCDSQHGVQLGPGSWKMLLGPYSASGMFSRNEPAPEPRPDKMEPGTGPGSFFGCVTPKTQQSRHHKSNTKLDKLGHCRHQASGLHVWVFLTFQYGATLPFMVIYLK